MDGFEVLTLWGTYCQAHFRTTIDVACLEIFRNAFVEFDVTNLLAREATIIPIIVAPTMLNVTGI
jgi:hypothetical protein